MQPRAGLLHLARSLVDQRESESSNRIVTNSQAGVQIAFQFAATNAAGRRATPSSSDAAAALTQTLEQLCATGHAAVPEPTVLMHAAHRARFDRALLARGLRRAIRQREIAREQIDDVPLLFPTSVRDAELTVARYIRQLAEGSPLIRSDRARLEKLSLLCSPAPFPTLDVLRRLLIRLSGMNCCPTLLVQGATEAQWFRWKLGRSVLEMSDWLRQGGSVRRSEAQASAHPIFIVLDASRLGLETTADVLEVIPREASLMLVGDPNEVPMSGHGQPFRDVLSTALFQCVRIKATDMDRERVSSPMPIRRSALSWRLRRGVGLSSNLRFGPIATIGVDDRVGENLHDLQR